MKRLGLVVAAALLGAMIAAPAVDAAPSTGFTGSWVGIDPVDGSTQHLYIQGGANVQVLYVDEFGTVCARIGAPTTVFTGVLTGSVFNGDVMVATFKAAGCGPKILLSGSDKFSWIFLYDSSTDTLFGAINDGPTTWSRA
ncbi:MAG TPA: hypothetical protein VJ506_00695 [Candidatus Limnocylindrales bacterium]|nr:hypothetical protein [Candidatus Limnocylindrales bacterium]